MRATTAGSPPRFPIGPLPGARQDLPTLKRWFRRFVEVFRIVSRLMMPATAPQDIVKLYERWTRTGSRWAARKLAELGVATPAPGRAQ